MFCALPMVANFPLIEFLPVSHFHYKIAPNYFIFMAFKFSKNKHEKVNILTVPLNIFAYPEL